MASGLQVCFAGNTWFFCVGYSSSCSSSFRIRLYGSVSYFDGCGRGMCAAIIAFLSANVKGSPRTRQVISWDAKISNIEI